MKSYLDQIESKLLSKSIPSDKNLQASYFSKLLDSCQEVSNILQKSTKDEVNSNFKKIDSVLNQLIFFNVGDFVNTDPFASFLGTFCLLLIKKDSLLSSNVFQILNNSLNSGKIKMNSKLLILSAINYIISNREEIEILSMMILQETLNNVIKLIKSSGSSNPNDLAFKTISMNIIRHLVKEKIANNFANRQDIFKLMLKFFNDKYEDLKAVTANGLLDFMENVELNFINQNFENLQSLCLKTLEESTKICLQKKMVMILASILDIHFQIDKDLSGKESSKINIIKFKSKKSNSNFDPNELKTKDKISEILNFTMIMVLKYPNIKFFLFEVLFVFLQKNKESITEKSFEDLIEFCFTTIQKTPTNIENDVFKLREVMGIMMGELIRFLNKTQITHLYYITTKNLNEIQKDMRLDYNYKQNRKWQIPDHLILFLLRVLLNLIHSLGTSIFEIIKKTNELADLLCPFLKHPHILIKLTSCHIFKTFAEKNPKWKSNLLSLILNLITVYYAEAEGLNDMNLRENSEGSVHETISGLHGHSICLSLLLRNTDFNLQSIPYDIANSIFETAKNLISTRRKTEKKPSKHVNLLEEELAYLQSLKIQAGWIMMEQLLSFDIHWVGSKLKGLFGLWQQQFSYENADLSSLEDQINELKISVPCLKTLRSFLRKCKTLQTDHVLKLVGTYLMNFFSAFLADTEKDKWKQAQERQINDYNLAKIEFFRCICSISPRFYQQKLNLLVQNVMDDIFISNFCNLTPVIKRFIDSDDILIAKNLENQIFKKSIILKPDHLRSEISIEKFEQIIFDYDQRNIMFKEKDHALKQNLSRILIEFMGLIYCSTAFTIKNKNNLLKYLKSNLKSILASKDSQAKNLKIIPFLLIGVSIILKLRKILENDGIYDKEFLENLKDISVSCWQVQNNYIRTLTSILYSNLFGLKLEGFSFEGLMSPLYENITETNHVSTITATIGFICKYNEHSNLKDYYLELSNVFQKASRSNDSKIWLLNSLKLALENHKENALIIFKTCFSFLILQYFLEYDLPNLQHYLYSHILEECMEILSQLDPLKQSSFLTTQFQAFLMDIYCKYLPYDTNLFKKSKLLLINAYFNYLFLKKEQIFKFTNLKYLLRNFIKLDISQKKNLLSVIELLIFSIQNNEFPKMASIDPDFHRNILQKFNSLNSYINPHRKLEENIIVLYNKVLFEELKLKVSTFEENFNFFKEILFSDNFLFRETLAARHSGEKVMSDTKEVEKPKGISIRRIFKNIIKNECPLEIEISVHTRVFILRCAEQLLTMINLSLMKKQEIVNFSSLIITFLFKIITSNFEELREIGLRLFIFTFKKLKKYNENGDLVKGNIYEPDQSLILHQFAVQIDAVISVNIKNELTNSPEINLQTFRLLFKFFKLFLNCDMQSIKKLVTLISKPIFNNLRIQPSSYFNEKAITSVHIKRLECLCKIYFYIINKSHKLVNDASILQELQEIFSPLIKYFLFQNICGGVHDDCVILTSSRTAIKNYHKYYFVYNGAKSSYDVKIHYETQNLFLRTFFSLKEEIQSYNFDEETFANQKNILILLRNNDKVLPKPDDMIKLCLSLLVYNLCFSEAYEQSKIQNSKKESKFLKSQLLSFFYSKIQIFENLKDFTGKYIMFMDHESLKDMLLILKKFLEYGINEIDQLIIEILTNISDNVSFSSENIDILLNLTIIIETILLRYKESYPNNDSVETNLIKTMKIQNKNIKILIEKGQFSLVNMIDLQSFTKNEKFAILNNFIFTLLEIFKFHKNSNIWYQIVSPIMIDVFQKLNSTLEKSKLKEDVLYLYLLNIYEMCLQNFKFKNHLILIFFSLHGIFKISSEDEENSNALQLYLNLINLNNFLNERKEFKDLLFLCRTLWQEQKTLDIYASLALLEITFSHVTQIREEISVNANNIDQTFIVEILKFFLAIYLFLNEERKEKYFHPLLEFIFLFINRNFPSQILSLANQILKHVLTSAKEQLVKSTLEKLSDDLRKVVEALMEMEKIGNQDNKASIDDKKRRNEDDQAVLNKDTENQSGQGKIKLKLFGAKK